MPTPAKKAKPKPIALTLFVQRAQGIDSQDVPLSNARAKRLIAAALCARSTHATITLRYVNESEGRRLNHQFRGKNKATNVLTFAYASPPEIYADLVMCLPVIEKEARSQSKPLDHHLAHLIVHGTLHACGLEHEENTEATAMERLEAGILKRFRIPDPYVVPLAKPRVAR